MERLHQRKKMKYSLSKYFTLNSQPNTYIYDLFFLACDGGIIYWTIKTRFLWKGFFGALELKRVNTTERNAQTHTYIMINRINRLPL